MSYRGSRRTISRERTRSEALEYRCPSAGHYASTCGVSFNDQATALMLRAGFVNLRFGRFRLSKNLALGRQLSGLSSASRLLYRPLGGHKSRWTSTACLEKASGNRTMQVVSTGGRSRLSDFTIEQTTACLAVCVPCGSFAQHSTPVGERHGCQRRPHRRSVNRPAG